MLFLHIELSKVTVQVYLKVEGIHCINGLGVDNYHFCKTPEPSLPLTLYSFFKKTHLKPDKI